MWVVKTFSLLIYMNPSMHAKHVKRVKGRNSQHRKCIHTCICLYKLLWWLSGKEHLPMQETGSVSGSGRSPGGGYGSPFQYSCLENPMNGRAWQAIVHGVAESDMTKHTCMLNTSKVNLLYKCIYLRLFRFFPHIAHYRVLSGVPCTIQ